MLKKAAIFFLGLLLTLTQIEGSDEAESRHEEGGSPRYTTALCSDMKSPGLLGRDADGRKVCVYPENTFT